MQNIQDIMGLNLRQRAAVLGNAVEMMQPLASQSVNPANQTVINFLPRNVGLIKGFLIEVTGTLTNGGGAAAALSNWGVSNLLRNITFTDLNNNQRVNVPGWYLAFLNSTRQGWIFGGSYASNMAIGYGNTFPVNAGAATLAAAAGTPVRMIYYVPLAYSGDDLRGSVFAGVTGGQMNLSVTINPTPFVAAPPVDQLGAVYTGNATGGWTGNVNVAVTQVYLDQLPVIDGSPVLPIMDLNTVYDLKVITQTGITPGVDNAIGYSNYRDFLTTTAVFNNGNTFNSGTDINYWALQSANFTNLFRLPPSLCALMARQILMSDPPPGTYLFNHRQRPINSQSFGNIELVINPITAGAGSVVTLGYESFAMINQLLGGNASSLGS